MEKTYKYAIGIDTGVHTGFAVWDIEAQRLLSCKTMKIDVAMETIRETWEAGYSILVIVEDARLRKFFKGENMAAKQQGAGSIKRDAKIWERNRLNKGTRRSYKIVIPLNELRDMLLKGYSINKKRLQQKARPKGTPL